MSQELTVIEQNPLEQIQNVNKIMSSLMSLQHYKRMGEEVVFAIVAKATSLKIDPLYALNGGLYNVKGKIGMSAEAMAAMIREKGHSIQKDEKSNDSICILHGRRADNGDKWTCKFSIEDAKKAGIYANQWEKYGAGMCYNRAMSFLARQLFPDIIKGSGYTMEELCEIANNKKDRPHSEMIEADFEEIIEKKPDQKIKLKKLANVELISEDQQKELLEVLKDCSPEYKKDLWQTLKEMIPPIKDLSDIPVKAFENILKAAQKNRMSYQGELAKADMETEEEKTA